MTKTSSSSLSTPSSSSSTNTTTGSACRSVLIFVSGFCIALIAVSQFIPISQMTPSQQQLDQLCPSSITIPKSIFDSKHNNNKNKKKNEKSADSNQQQQQQQGDSPQQQQHLVSFKVSEDLSRPAPYHESSFDAPLTHEQKNTCSYSLQRGRESVTQCPDEELYLALWLLIRKGRRKWTIVDVGSNKGYSVAAMLEAFNVSVDHFSRQQLGVDIFTYAKDKKLPKNALHSLAGACCDCAGEFVWKNKHITDHAWFINRQRDVEIASAEFYMYDGTKSHVNYVNHFFPQQNEKYIKSYFEENVDENDKKLNASITVDARTNNKKNLIPLRFFGEWKAVSSKPGTTKFCQAHLGAEVAKIGKTEGCNPVIEKDVQVTTLNEALPAHVNEIDILLTDTEGFDFDVYEGARKRFFETGKVGIYIFEIQKGPTNPRTVKSVLDELSGFGYRCYYPVHGIKIKRHVVPISGDCWNGGYEFNRGWMNIVCANEKRFPELTRVFQQLQEMRKDWIWYACQMDQVEQRFFKHHPELDVNWIRGLKK